MEKKFKRIVVLLGIPGSGKGTQAKIMMDHYGYEHISTGDMLRKMVANKNLSKTDKEMLEKMKFGRLVPNSLIYRVAFAAIQTALAEKNGVVLDGAVRNVAQAKHFQKYFLEHGLKNEVIAMEIRITDKSSFDRLSKRKICDVCGHIIPYLPQNMQINKCDKCGGHLIVREDDNVEIIKNRIKEQGNGAIRPIADYYEKIKLLHIVDGELDIGTVESKVKEIIEKSK